MIYRYLSLPCLLVVLAVLWSPFAFAQLEEQEIDNIPDKSDTSSFTSYGNRTGANGSRRNNPDCPVGVSNSCDQVTQGPTVRRRTGARTSRRIRIRETAASGLPPTSETRFEQDEVIVRFRLASSRQSRRNIINSLRLIHLDVDTFFLPGVTVHRYGLPAGADVRSTIAALEQSGAVVNAQPNYIYTLQQEQSSGKLQQFANTRINLAAAHETTDGDAVRIAIIDTAVDAGHVELKSASVNLFDVSDSSDKNVDPHGTAIAGILAANGKLTGVAPGARLIGIAAFSKNSSGNVAGNTWTILDALNIALEQKAEILNLSFAGPFDPLMKQSFEGAERRNMISVAAAGNEGPDADELFPAAYQTVVAVTATNSMDAIYEDANQGDYVELAAPGVGVLVLSSNSGFRSASGTSMATAYVSGVLALTRAANPQLDILSLRELLARNSVDVGEKGRDPVFGAGIPDAAMMVAPLTN